MKLLFWWVPMSHSSNVWSHCCPITCSEVRGEVEIQLYPYSIPVLEGAVVSAMPWLLYHQERDPVFIVYEVGWVLRVVRMGPENLTPTRVWNPDCPAHSSFYTDYTTPPAIISKLIHRFTKSFNWNFYDGEINNILGYHLLRWQSSVK
jgi:hypothetical protein